MSQERALPLLATGGHIGDRSDKALFSRLNRLSFDEIRGSSHGSLNNDHDFCSITSSKDGENEEVGDDDCGSFEEVTHEHEDEFSDWGTLGSVSPTPAGTTSPRSEQSPSSPLAVSPTWRRLFLDTSFVEPSKESLDDDKGGPSSVSPTTAQRAFLQSVKTTLRSLPVESTEATFDSTEGVYSASPALSQLYVTPIRDSLLDRQSFVDSKSVNLRCAEGGSFATPTQGSSPQLSRSHASPWEYSPLNQPSVEPTEVSFDHTEAEPSSATPALASSPRLSRSPRLPAATWSLRSSPLGEPSETTGAFEQVTTGFIPYATSKLYLRMDQESISKLEGLHAAGQHLELITIPTRVTPIRATSPPPISSCLRERRHSFSDGFYEKYREEILSYGEQEEESSSYEGREEGYSPYDERERECSPYWERGGEYSGYGGYGGEEYSNYEEREKEYSNYEEHEKEYSDYEEHEKEYSDYEEHEKEYSDYEEHGGEHSDDEEHGEEYSDNKDNRREHLSVEGLLKHTDDAIRRIKILRTELGTTTPESASSHPTSQSAYSHLRTVSRNVLSSILSSTKLMQEQEQEQVSIHYKLQLPLELWTKICSYLYPSQLARFALVNKTAYGMIASLKIWSQWFALLHGPTHELSLIPGILPSQSYMLYLCAISFKVCERCLKLIDGTYRKGRLAEMPLPVVLDTHCYFDEDDEFCTRTWTVRICRSCRVTHYRTHPESLSSVHGASYLTKSEIKEKYMLSDNQVKRITNRIGGGRNSGKPVQYSERKALEIAREEYGGDVGVQALKKSLSLPMKYMEHRVYIYFKRLQVVESGGTWWPHEEYLFRKKYGLL
ncbi:hypothetical protein BGX21_006985 [Mortierella sp. AD011]|nr:hypothetical protein BGX20_006110 [Mortierella sp. AD010]KAF9398986.1 hypothetical protein BGX21_006985 [Mortierella sp. AD011]